MPEQIDLGFIKTRRKELKLSQTDMAIALGFKSASTYSKYESGEYSLKANMLPILASLLKVKVINFFELKSSETEHN